MGRADDSGLVRALHTYLAMTDILDILKKEHDAQRTLMDIIEKTSTGEGRRDLYTRFSRALRAHARAEERAFYSVLLEKQEGRGKAAHSIKEHQEAMAILDELDEKDCDDAGWLRRFKTLADDNRHHMEEEEEEAFEVARRLLDAKEREAIGERFLTYEEEAKEAA